MNEKEAYEKTAAGRIEALNKAWLELWRPLADQLVAWLKKVER